VQSSSALFSIGGNFTEGKTLRPKFPFFCKNKFLKFVNFSEKKEEKAKRCKIQPTETSTVL
jgi:hypothetical protein